MILSILLATSALTEWVQIASTIFAIYLGYKLWEGIRSDLADKQEQISKLGEMVNLLHQQDIHRTQQLKHIYRPYLALVSTQEADGTIQFELENQGQALSIWRIQLLKGYLDLQGELYYLKDRKNLRYRHLHPNEKIKFTFSLNYERFKRDMPEPRTKPEQMIRIEYTDLLGNPYQTTILFDEMDEWEYVVGNLDT